MIAVWKNVFDINCSRYANGKLLYATYINVTYNINCLSACMCISYSSMYVLMCISCNAI